MEISLDWAMLTHSPLNIPTADNEMTITIWLRAETKPREARSALTPTHVRTLLQNGFKVVVEKSPQRAIADDRFAETGCELVAPGAWKQAPVDAFILGIKDLPDESKALIHRHIYFGHAYKTQAGWQRLLRRFVNGKGTLFDLEYLVDDKGRRVAAFGYWAGFTGCAVGLMVWVGQRLKRRPVVAELSPYTARDNLVDELRRELTVAVRSAGRKPSIIILGAGGRVGGGAADLADALELRVTKWDIEETARGGPFEEILQHDIFVNCVLVREKIPPFVTLQTLAAPGRVLSVVSDVSCDPGEYNPVPIYSEPTTFSAPVTNVIAEPPLDVTAIDHLPSLLPVEASEDFGSQLLPHLLTLSNVQTGVWRRALDVFQQKTRNL